MTLEIKENVSLKRMNTLGLDVYARYFCTVESTHDLVEALSFAETRSMSIFILGGGSNIVLLDDLNLLVISIGLLGIEYDGCEVTAMAGENWHGLVLSTIDHGLSGIENLSLIPGLVGAAPIQNIGAYGVELADRLVELTVIDRSTRELQKLTKNQCLFGYRNSIFKNDAKDRFVILSIRLRLDKDFSPVLDYADLKNEFGSGKPGSARELSDAVTKIRLQKLPDPNQTGNVGSFFKNPEVTASKMHQLQRINPALRFNQQSSGLFKVSAAMLIDNVGMKGVQHGGAQVSEQHALVITNAGQALGGDVMALANQIIEKVSNRFDIILEIEPVVVSLSLA